MVDFRGEFHGRGLEGIIARKLDINKKNSILIRASRLECDKNKLDECGCSWLIKFSEEVTRRKDGEGCFGLSG
jgi:hypothetical protein